MKLTLKVTIGCLGVLILHGCQEKTNSIKTWDEKRAQDRHEMEDNLSMMVDSAMLFDLSLADIHFVPHTTYLNDLGERRLSRYLELLKDYGGTLHLESSTLDGDFRLARVEHIVDFLASSGVDGSRIEILEGIPRSLGIAAFEAIEVRAVQYDPNRQPLTDLITGGTGGAMGTAGGS